MLLAPALVNLGASCSGFVVRAEEEDWLFQNAASVGRAFLSCIGVSRCSTLGRAALLPGFVGLLLLLRLRLLLLLLLLGHVLNSLRDFVPRGRGLLISLGTVSGHQVLCGRLQVRRLQLRGRGAPCRGGCAQLRREPRGQRVKYVTRLLFASPRAHGSLVKMQSSPLNFVGRSLRKLGEKKKAPTRARFHLSAAASPSVVTRYARSMGRSQLAS